MDSIFITNFQLLLRVPNWALGKERRTERQIERRTERRKCQSVSGRQGLQQPAIGGLPSRPVRACSTHNPNAENICEQTAETEEQRPVQLKC